MGVVWIAPWAGMGRVKRKEEERKGKERNGKRKLQSGSRHSEGN